MNAGLIKNLTNYSAVAGLTLLSGSADAQVIYHNIEPDFLGVEDATFQLDLNNDGLIDLKLNQSFYSSTSFSEDSWSLYSHEFSSFELFGNTTNNAKVLGIDSLTVLEMGDTIGAAGPWSNGGLMRFRSHEWTFESNYWGGDWWNLDNNSFGNWLNKTDKYIGIRVMNGGEPYYGWVRLSVSLSQFTVKDYGISEVPGVAVLAGQIDCGNLESYVSTVSGDSVSCYGNAMKLIAHAPPVQQLTYQWLKNNAEITGADDSIYYAVSEGVYSFKFTVNSGCADSSDAINILFPPTPAPAITFSSDTLFSGYATGNQWYLNQFVIPGATDYYYVANQGGNYKVRVDTFNCYGFSNEISFFPTGINPLPEQEFYCAVESGKLHIHRNNNHPPGIKGLLYNTMGQLMLDIRSADNEIVIDLEKYPAGMYVVTFSDGNTHRFFRFIKS